MKNSTVSRLIKYVGKSRAMMLAVMLCTVVSGFASLICPLIIGNAADIIAARPEGWFNTLLSYLVYLGVLYLIYSFLTWLTSLLAHKVAIFTAKRLRCEVFAKLSRLPLKYFDTHKTGDIINRVTNDIEAVDDGLSHAIVQLVSGVATVCIALGFMLKLNPYVALVAVFVTPLCFFTGFIITKYGKKKFASQADSVSARKSCVNEMITSADTVRAFNYEKKAKERFSELNSSLYESGWKAQFASALVNPTTRFVNNTAYVLVGIVSIIAVINGDLTVGGIAAFLSYTSQFSKPINEMTSITMQLQLATAGARRVFSLLDEEEEPASDQSAVSDVRLKGNVEFDRVSFSYVSSRPLIKDFTFKAGEGTRVAIVGPTGAGKTTVVNLLMRFYDVDSGAVKIDGIDIRDMQRQCLRNNIGMVLQETWLFSGTIRDNIAYGRPDATDSMIIEAAKKAHAHSFIMKLPQGYGTAISSEGGSLSAGQRQLLAISRVMLMDTSMIILDEATSNVDILTEKRIRNAFETLMKGKTSFVIAHRLSTITDSDVILVMKDGNIVERGTHSELIRLGGVYSGLYNSFDS